MPTPSIGPAVPSAPTTAPSSIQTQEPASHALVVLASTPEEARLSWERYAEGAGLTGRHRLAITATQPAKGGSESLSGRSLSTSISICCWRTSSEPSPTALSGCEGGGHEQLLEADPQGHAAGCPSAAGLRRFRPPRFHGCRNKADVARIIGLLAEAAWYPKPKWYAPLRVTDTYVATLRSGEVLALSAFKPGVPQELFAWSSEYSGTVVWREGWKDGDGIDA